MEIYKKWHIRARGRRESRLFCRLLHPAHDLKRHARAEAESVCIDIPLGDADQLGGAVVVFFQDRLLLIREGGHEMIVVGVNLFHHLPLLVRRLAVFRDGGYFPYQSSSRIDFMISLPLINA